MNSQFMFQDIIFMLITMIKYIINTKENKKRTIVIIRFEGYQKRFTNAKFTSFFYIVGPFSVLPSTKLRTSCMTKFGVAWNEAVKGKLRPYHIPRNVTTLLNTCFNCCPFYGSTTAENHKDIRTRTWCLHYAFFLSSSCNKLHNAPCIMTNVQENRSAKPTELTGVKFLRQSFLTGHKAYTQRHS